MNDRPSSLLVTTTALLALALLACDGLDGGDISEPRFGNWWFTSSVGEITYVESGSISCDATWTYPTDTEGSMNMVRVYSRGEFEYFVSLAGVPNSPFPEGYVHVGSGTGAGGEIFGHTINESLGTESSITGTYDDTVMNGTWTMTQHVGEPGGCTTDANGSGSFTATRL